MNIFKTIFAVVVFGLILSSLFFFDANPVLWGVLFLFFYVFEKGTEFFNEKKHLKAVALYLLSATILAFIMWFIVTHYSIYLLIIVPLGYILYYLYKKVR